MKPKKQLLRLFLFTIILILSVSVLIKNNTRQKMNLTQNHYDQNPISAHSQNSLLANVSEQGNYDDGGKLASLLLYNIVNDTGNYYEFTYTLDAYVENSNVPKPFGLSIQWVDNDSANFFLRYVDESDSVKAHVYIEEKFVINVSKLVGYYRVLIWYDSYGLVILTHQEDQYQEFQNDDSIMPILVTSPHHFTYMMNIYIRDKSESVYYQISTEVFWPDLSDYAAYGTAYMTTNTQIPQLSFLNKNVNMTFRMANWIKTDSHNSNSIYYDQVLKNSDQVTSIPIEWSSQFPTGASTGSIYSWSAAEVKYDRWFIHSYLIELDFRTCEVELQFGTLEEPKSIRGFIGIHYFLTIAVITLIIWRKKVIPPQNLFF